jgi:TetR/AcrR family transcriptional repressor of bet genes
MGPLRRRQLVDATIASIHQYGLADATVTRIAKKAGVSAGIVHHYFADKDELLFETMRVMLAELKTGALARFADNDTAQQRLTAIIQASFSAEQFSPEVVTAWLALYASARKSPSLTRILALYHRRLRSNLLFALKKLSPLADHAFQAEAIAALIDGLYLRAALNPDLHDMDSPRAIAHQLVDHITRTGHQQNG